VIGTGLFAYSAVNCAISYCGHLLPGIAKCDMERNVSAPSCIGSCICVKIQHEAQVRTMFNIEKNRRSSNHPHCCCLYQGGITLVVTAGN
jgi:hypothetical protein